uniref:Putative RNA polymerase n=1 Tax=Kwi virus TaxID=2081616 RepID=A0A3G4QDZ5_9VIRU|nr:putative RNA polymerase [Kwi virus]
MRAGKSKRFSHWLFATGRESVDYCAEVKKLGFRIVYRKGRGFTATYRRGDFIFERVHKCHFYLAKLAYSHWKNQTLTSFQQQVVHATNMTTPLSRAIKRDLEDKGVPLVRMAGFRHTRPQPLTKLKNKPAEVVSALSVLDSLPESLKEGIEQYHHSSEVENMALMVKGYTVLHEKAVSPADFETFYEMFVRMSLEVPETVEENDDITVGHLQDQPQPSSSCGLLPLNSLFGACQGSKKEMQNSASAVNWADLAWRCVPSCLPNKAVHKDEVIKKGKKIRTIMIESQANNMVLRHYFEKTVSKDRDIPRGRAIGLSGVGGSFKIIVLRWYDIVSRHNGMGWNEFLLWLAKQPINESDKTAWESSTNEVDGLPYVIYLLLTIADVSDPVAQRILARALADYMNPPVQIDSDLVTFAPWRVASGSYFTAHGNTFRHWLMGQWVCDFIAKHDNMVGKDDCSCDVCAHFKHNSWFGVAVTELELELMRAFFVMGDDFIGLGYHGEAFNSILDFKFKTTTKGEIKEFFSMPSLEEPTGAEFLKKHFYLDTSGRTYNIRTFRAPARLLAKLSKGRATQSATNFRIACQSALWEIGYNQPLYDIVREVTVSVDVPKEDVKQQLERYIKRSPLMADCSLFYVPEFEMIVNADASIIRPLEKYYWSVAVWDQHGVPLTRY